MGKLTSLFEWRGSLSCTTFYESCINVCVSESVNDGDEMIEMYSVESL